jgi:hypothetical protein
MKNLVIAASVLVMFGLTSCKKDYVCECKITRTQNGSTLTTEDGEYTFKDKRTRAESRCNDEEKSGSDAFGDYTRDCQIK